MPEEGDAGTDVAKIESTEVHPVTEMDLYTARTILQAVVDTPESTITEQTPLDQFAGHSTQQLRTASRVVVEAVMKEREVGPSLSGPQITSKTTPQGRLELSSAGQFLLLGLSSPSGKIHSTFALEEQQDNVDRMVTAFHDSRPGIKESESLYDTQRNPTIGSFQRMVKGL